MGDLTEDLINSISDQIQILIELLCAIDPKNKRGSSYRTYSFLEKLGLVVIKHLEGGKKLSDAIVSAKDLAQIVNPAESERGQTKAKNYIKNDILETLERHISRVNSMFEQRLADAGYTQKIALYERNLGKKDGLHFGFQFVPLHEVQSCEVHDHENSDVAVPAVEENSVAFRNLCHFPRLSSVGDDHDPTQHPIRSARSP